MRNIALCVVSMLVLLRTLGVFAFRPGDQTNESDDDDDFDACKFLPY